MLVVANRNGMRIFNLFVDDKTEWKKNIQRNAQMLSQRKMPEIFFEEKSIKKKASAKTENA